MLTIANFHFKEMNSDFTDQLVKLKLSKSKVRQCILVRSHLNSNEIAEVCNINVNSVYIQRHRLSQKLRLESTYKLDSYIVNL